MTAPEEGSKAYCRHCGGERRHRFLARTDIPWDDYEEKYSGHDSWQTLQCCGCDTISFRHVHWFSEDRDMDDNLIIHNEQFPPAPSRKPPEWKGDIWLCVRIDQDQDWSVSKLFDDIYAALGLGAHSLAAMGVRAILDWLVTSTVGPGNFTPQLQKLRDGGRITQQRYDVIYAAFDAGSAAAHRGHSPTESDVNIMLSIMESLLYDLKIKPIHDEQEAKKASELKSKTPLRPKP